MWRQTFCFMYYAHTEEDYLKILIPSFVYHVTRARRSCFSCPICSWTSFGNWRVEEAPSMNSHRENKPPTSPLTTFLIAVPRKLINNVTVLLAVSVQLTGNTCYSDASRSSFMASAEACSHPWTDWVSPSAHRSPPEQKKTLMRLLPGRNAPPPPAVIGPWGL